MNEGHVRLLRELCALAKISDVERVLETRTIAFADVAFSLMPETTAFGEMLAIYCEYGGIPASKEAAVQRRLLEVNLVLAKEFLPISFCFNPDTQKVLLVMRTLVADTTAQSLIDTLEATSEQAQRWRHTHYLESDRPFASAASMLRLDARDKPQR